MIIKQGLEAEYRQFLEVNSRDGYSFAAVQFMGRWADLMETEMASGAALPDIAERTSHQADTDLITGFQYGCAVSALPNFGCMEMSCGSGTTKDIPTKGRGRLTPPCLQF